MFPMVPNFALTENNKDLKMYHLCLPGPSESIADGPHGIGLWETLGLEGSAHVVLNQLKYYWSWNKHPCLPRPWSYCRHVCSLTE